MLGSGAGPDPAFELASMCVRAHCLNRQTVHARGNSPREIPAGSPSQATVRRQRERRKAARRAPMILANVRHVILDLRKAQARALTLRLALCDFA